MRQVLPLHPLSVKILAKEYTDIEDGVLRITARDPLFYMLCIRAPKRERFTRSIQRKLTTSIQIDVTVKLDDPGLIGLNIYKQHMRQLLKQVHAMCLLKNNAMANIKYICGTYGIDDDDIDLDSLARAWRRYRKGKPLPDNGDNFRHNTRQNQVLYNDIGHTYLSFSIEDCDRGLHYIVCDAIEKFKTKRCRFSTTLYNALQAYVYYHFGKINHEQIAAKLDTPRATITDRIASITNMLQYDEELAEAIRTAYQHIYEEVTAPPVL